jgi:hypothetical protein
MSTETAVMQETCPFTLEVCEDCCELRVPARQEICPFTLESCCFHERVVFTMQ